MKLKALIVDDEYPARKELRFLLNKFDNIEVVGEATNAQEALTLIKALDYSILFLDIEMPGMNGLEVGAKVQEMPSPPHVVFVTAYDEYAVRAFEVNAVDYILKPFDEKRLTQTINKIVKINQQQAVHNTDDSAEEQPVFSQEGAAKAGQKPQHIKIDRIPAEKQGKTILVNESDIIYAFTEQDYVYIKTFSDKLFTRFTLKELESRLNPSIFFRTHRCYLANLHKVKEIIPFFNGTYTLIVEDNEKSEVPVSRAQAKKLRKILGM
ncbi:LytR/AlgR family response regulator transcription factor [Phosphitispora fastidiosa]|uniref:LytR/AlgR family response regulator transcription factor n=1 Tax=Phosphitispora fastidiosa TaxID=2837202 RepID=UPI001E372C67|nr:LytTR family DNA-binding domain-containing protein [Phosphitispora fastidiosa]MBU7007979.1 two-component system LytT family response regulator [Phosphitispora fastidiosa]